MDKLLRYINDLPVLERANFCARCGTSEGYLRKVCSTGAKLGERLCINIERESNGVITCEELRDDVDWAFIRGTSKALVA